jgi:hypothetical protein
VVQWGSLLQTDGTYPSLSAIWDHLLPPLQDSTVNMLLNFSFGFLRRTTVSDTLVCYGWNGSVVIACMFWTFSLHGEGHKIYLV